MLSTTYYLYKGGAGALDGVNLNEHTDRNRYEMVLSKRVKSGKYYLYLGQDHDTKNGLIEDLRLSFRYQHYL